MMKTGKLIIKLSFVFLIFVSGCAGETDSPFFFIQMTDPQFGMFEPDGTFKKETELYEKAVCEINRLNPDFVVITGDLVNIKDDRAQVEEFKRITAEINSKIPVLKP